MGKAISTLDLDSIVVAVDGSEHALLAAEQAAMLAKSLGATLHAFTLIDETKEAQYSALHKEAETALSAVTRMAKGHGVKVEVKAIIDRYPDGILAAAERAGGDLLAIGTHGKTGYRANAFGSMADYLLRNSPIALLTQTAKVGVTPYRLSQASPEGLRVLVPLQEGAVPQALMGTAQALGRTRNATVTLMCVAPEKALLPQAFIEKAAATMAASGIVRPATRLLVGDPPGREVLKAVLVERSDVIVMGSHGRGRLARALLGSVSAHVVGNSPAPVIVVPMREPLWEAA